MLDCLVKALHPSLAPLDPCLAGNTVCAQSYDPRGHTLVSLSCPLRPFFALPPTGANSLEYIWYFTSYVHFPFLFKILATYLYMALVMGGVKSINHLEPILPRILCSSWHWSGWPGSQPAHETPASGLLLLYRGHKRSGSWPEAC